MSDTIVDVVAPSRLHFGLLSFGQPGTRQFGGAGVMVGEPGLRLRIASADRFEAVGPLAERVRAVVERFARLKELATAPACRIEVLEAPLEHVGLGTGTQLGLSVVAGLHAFGGGSDGELLTPAALAALAGRAARSAIGTYGFVHGGLLVDAGKRDGEVLAPLEQRLELPSAWRFVLICSRHERGLSGEAERCAFRDLPPVPRSTTDALHDELSRELLPAATDGQFQRFSESLYRYGTAAGMCFAARQGGAFASPRLAELVGTIRALGVGGVGQSSWGPTIFAVLENRADAHDFRDRIRRHIDERDALVIAEPNNSGAAIARHDKP
jgi:beta-ribofuranosylaminobenzene 5'-phosphate synthase